MEFRHSDEVCGEAKQMIDDWNNNIVGKVRRSDATNIK